MHQYKPLKIGNITLDGNLILAPMAGYTDQAFRQISMEHGASMAYAEMSSCEALWRNIDSEKTDLIMQPYPNEKHLALQLFAGNAEAVANSMPRVLAMKPAIVDFNVGCPVPKVNKSGAGSALMQNTDELKAILTTIRALVPKEIPMTVKFRSGWTQESRNYLDVAEIALNAGADMISMHPRTRSQAYGGNADWSLLKTLKETFPDATVCASGDLMSPEAIKQMFEETGVDAAMIARGSIGNPFIFNQTKELMTTGSYHVESDRQRVQVAHQHLTLMYHYRGERYTTNEIKKHLAQYMRGNALFTHYRKALVLATSYQEMLTLFDELLANLHTHAE
ncbi:tRNA dihydrouridine synthase DusB [Entomospira culicis]|uniref:tRNA-dihydrouridine synthase n=1 Tax=Entomospira culicis TaxID=2719989 RepID=A0A968KUA2_9SPIO|nr:tRNA dihydrouridine synthase DusB [Entomospira culicis]NIZ18715.1 tRNA dihydrouridine synthase DusB [Entomospira culicis]NIZ68930.1 tRNA dihydrouridine synthase DusB [Entomospira culicis]WDI37523.1 tRNA dihydrouridine synthase DusB [Entomospira culicis]WDI39151.1 tRNA dihydrouridine synthase DusB [Entomospira culicis]